MNYLRICRYLYAKRFWNEIILLVQLVFMLIFAFTVLNPIDEFLQKKQKIVNSYDIDFDEALHFNMGNFVYEYQQQHYGENSLTDDIYEKIIETEGVGLVFQSGTETIILIKQMMLVMQFIQMRCHLCIMMKWHIM